MQHQRERDPVLQPKPQRPPRSLGVLLTAWLLLLWGGAITTIVLRAGAPSHHDPLLDQVAFVVFVLHGVLCFLSGILSLLRRPSLARWFLTAAAVCLGLVGAWIVWWSELHRMPNLSVAALMIVFSVCFLVLARWLGKQEDLEN